jgi:hypothetical protein
VLFLCYLTRQSQSVTGKKGTAVLTSPTQAAAVNGQAPDPATLQLLESAESWVLPGLDGWAGIEPAACRYNQDETGWGGAGWGLGRG